MEQNSKEDTVADKAKKGKVKTESNSSSDEEDDAEDSLPFKGFKSFFNSMEGQKVLKNKRKQFSR